MSPSSSQIRVIAWLHLGISKPSTSRSHLRSLYSSGRVPQGKTQVGAELVLHHPGNPKVNLPSKQLQTTSEHHHPAPAQLIFHRWRGLVVSDYSQSLQLIGLSKSLPLFYLQQLRLTYKRRVYSAHMKGTPQVCSLGDRGGCATEPYRTPATL